MEYEMLRVGRITLFVHAIDYIFDDGDGGVRVYVRGRPNPLGGFTTEEAEKIREFARRPRRMRFRTS